MKNWLSTTLLFVDEKNLNIDKDAKVVAKANYLTKLSPGDYLGG